MTSTYRDTLVAVTDPAYSGYKFMDDSSHNIMTCRHDIITGPPSIVTSTRISIEDINAISSLLKGYGYRDTSIFIHESSMHGGLAQNLTITCNGHKVKYMMWNQGDSISYKIIRILNKYLPEKYKISPLLTDWDAFFESLQKSFLRSRDEE